MTVTCLPSNLLTCPLWDRQVLPFLLLELTSCQFPTLVKALYLCMRQYFLCSIYRCYDGHIFFLEIYCRALTCSNTAHDVKAVTSKSYLSTIRDTLEQELRQLLIILRTVAAILVLVLLNSFRLLQRVWFSLPMSQLCTTYCNAVTFETSSCYMSYPSFYGVIFFHPDPIDYHYNIYCIVLNGSSMGWETAH